LSNNSETRNAIIKIKFIGLKLFYLGPGVNDTGLMKNDKRECCNTGASLQLACMLHVVSMRCAFTPLATICTSHGLDGPSEGRAFARTVGQTAGGQTVARTVGSAVERLSLYQQILHKTTTLKGRSVSQGTPQCPDAQI